MSPTWALRLEPREGPALGPLRRMPGPEAPPGLTGLEVCLEGAALWLRGPDPDDGLAATLRALPASARFVVDEQGLLRPPGARLPVGRLPRGPWWPLARWLRPRLPEGGRDPAPAPEPLALRLVRAGPDDVHPDPELLRLPLAALAAWAEEASALRLARLSLAVDTGDPPRALVRGQPLPPLPGERLVVVEGVAWPVGYAPRPGLDPGALSLTLALLPGELALLDPQGGREVVPGGAFVPATRAAIRAAWAARSGGAGPGAGEVGGG